ncbi:hypothetical protein MPC1_4350001 [Methylocella tundrae]|nr:hypothetical protein MPC1_4350001 [Methylocella tundrae]
MIHPLPRDERLTISAGAPGNEAIKLENLRSPDLYLGSLFVSALAGNMQRAGSTAPPPRICSIYWRARSGPKS